jgi:hypothetical protein
LAPVARVSASAWVCIRVPLPPAAPTEPAAESVMLPAMSWLAPLLVMAVPLPVL